ncbi:MAG: hypothetical protein IJQ23_03800 [Clostridia bacterium]|nr:hypothetical protein [Clostridia bacterium]
MFAKVFGVFFVKTSKKSGLTVISGKREIKAAQNRTLSRGERTDAYWDNRGKTFGALFTAINGRIF